MSPMDELLLIAMYGVVTIGVMHFSETFRYKRLEAGVARRSRLAPGLRRGRVVYTAASDGPRPATAVVRRRPPWRSTGCRAGPHPVLRKRIGNFLIIIAVSFPLAGLLSVASFLPERYSRTGLVGVVFGRWHP